MNIFTKFEHIFGNPDVSGFTRGLDEFFVLTNELRPRLGGKAYLLDEYVRMLLEAANYAPLNFAADDGFGAAREFHEVLSAALGGIPNGHPLYEEFHEFVIDNPLPYQESVTRERVYVIMLSSRFLEYAVESYWDELRKNCDMFDVVELRRLYEELCAVLGREPEMERLNLIIRQVFLTTPPVAGFIQGLTNDLVQAMVNMDAETRRYCYELASAMAKG